MLHVLLFWSTLRGCEDEEERKMTGVFHHILVPYNGVPCSKIAFKKAVTLAQSIQAKITVLDVS